MFVLNAATRVLAGRLADPWQRLAQGCRCSRATVELILASGLEVEELRHIVAHDAVERQAVRRWPGPTQDLRLALSRFSPGGLRSTRMDLIAWGVDDLDDSVWTFWRYGHFVETCAAAVCDFRCFG